MRRSIRIVGDQKRQIIETNVHCNGTMRLLYGKYDISVVSPQAIPCIYFQLTFIQTIRDYSFIEPSTFLFARMLHNYLIALGILMRFNTEIITFNLFASRIIYFSCHEQPCYNSSNHDFRYDNIFMEMH